MSLPNLQLQYQTFEVTIPSTQKKIRLRPFLVKEEKILLVAQNGGKFEDIMYAVKQVINNCIITPNINVETFSSFDIDYIYVKLRGRSVNNVIEQSWEDNEDKKVYNFVIDLDTVEIEYNETHSNKISLINDMTLVLKYPSTTLNPNIGNLTNLVEILYEVMKGCLDKIYDKDEIHLFSDYSDKEIDEFFSTLSVGSFNAIKDFLETMPKLKHTMIYQNSLGNERKIVLEGLLDFFTLG